MQGVGSMCKERAIAAPVHYRGFQDNGGSNQHGDQWINKQNALLTVYHFVTT